LLPFSLLNIVYGHYYNDFPFLADYDTLGSASKQYKSTNDIKYSYI
jgi:hypothetical protein